jgi:hypothetical protein
VGISNTNVALALPKGFSAIRVSSPGGLNNIQVNQLNKHAVNNNGNFGKNVYDLGKIGKVHNDSSPRPFGKSSGLNTSPDQSNGYVVNNDNKPGYKAYNFSNVINQRLLGNNVSQQKFNLFQKGSTSANGSNIVPSNQSRKENDTDLKALSSRANELATEIDSISNVIFDCCQSLSNDDNDMTANSMIANLPILEELLQEKTPLVNGLNKEVVYRRAKSKSEGMQADFYNEILSIPLLKMNKAFNNLSCLKDVLEEVVAEIRDEQKDLIMQTVTGTVLTNLSKKKGKDIQEMDALDDENEDSEESEKKENLKSLIANKSKNQVWIRRSLNPRKSNPASNASDDNKHKKKAIITEDFSPLFINNNEGKPKNKKNNVVLLKKVKGSGEEKKTKEEENKE